jgi:hypothetical protein
MLVIKDALACQRICRVGSEKHDSVGALKPVASSLP